MGFKYVPAHTKSDAMILKQLHDLQAAQGWGSLLMLISTPGFNRILCTYGLTIHEGWESASRDILIPLKYHQFMLYKTL